MEKMRNRKSNPLLVLIICVSIALAGVISVVIYKEIEYRVSAEYYSELRSGE